MEEFGYQVYSVLTKESATNICDDFLKETCEMILGYYENRMTTHLLTDFNLRVKNLKDPKCVWKQGNMKSPIISKTSGHVNIYMNQNLLQCKLLPEVKKVFSTLYNTEDLSYCSHEQPVVKPYKSIVSNVAWDLQKTRYKGYLCLSGGDLIQVIPGLHKLKKLMSQYMVDEKIKFLNVSQISNFIYQHTKDSKLADVKWQTIRLQPGDLFVHDTSIPFQTLPNKGHEPFVVLPIDMVPESEMTNIQKKKVWTQLTKFQFGDWLSNVGDNREEVQWRKINNTFPKISLEANQSTLFCGPKEPIVLQK